jgi:uncharacterized membrane protein
MYREENMSEEIDALILKVAEEMKAVRLQALIDKLQADYGIDPSESTKKIYLLWKNKKIDILEIRLKFFDYLISAFWFWVLNLLVLLTVALTLFPVENLLYVRYVVGSIYIFYLPGYVLIGLLYPRGEELDPLTRMTLSIVSSLAIVVLVAFLLNYTPYGVRLIPIMTSLTLLTEGLSILTLLRRYQVHASSVTP